MASSHANISAALDENELLTISPAVRYKLEIVLGSKTTELGDLKSKYEKLRVTSEQQLFELEKKIISSSSQLETEEKAKNELHVKLIEIEKLFTEAKTKLSEQEAEISTFKAKQMELTNANNLLEAEKRDLNGFLEKREKDIQRLKEDLKELSNKVTAANTEKCNVQAELMKVQSVELTRQYSERRLQQEKEQLQKQVDFLNMQLSDKTKEFVTFRREKASTMLELQGSVEEKTEEVKYLQATIDALKSSKEDQAAKIETLSQKLKEARDMQMTVEEQYRQELTAQEKLVNLYKESTDINNTKVTELTRAVEELQKLLKEANAAYTELETTRAEEIEKLNDKIREKELKIEELQQELKHANELLAAKKSGMFSFSQDEVETMFPAAAATSKILKSGMTLTQIYSEYMQAVETVETQKIENKRLNYTLEQILQEIEDKAPKLKKQRDDYQAAMQMLDQLTPQLDAAMLECEKLRSDNEDLRRRSNYFQRENARIQQRNIDLSRQVKFLLKEIQEMKGGCVVPDESESEVSSTQPESSSSRIISERLVTFRNIAELQEKNQELLESLRDLSRAREEEENEASNVRVRELRDQLEEASMELARLRSDRTRQAEMVEAIVRQRDMYRVLLQHGGGSPVSSAMVQALSPTPLTSTPMPGSNGQALVDGQSLAGARSMADLEKAVSDSQMALRELQAEYNTYRKEKMENEKILNEQLEKARNELSENRVNNARLASQLDHAADRYKVLQNNAESYRKEIAALQDKCQRYSTSVARHELTITTLKEDVFEKQQLASTWEVKVDHLRQQYDTLRTHEQRLVTELESLRRERQSQAMLNANLEAIQNNLERAEFESKTRYTNRIDSLEKEVALLKRKLECAEEEKATTISAMERLSGALDVLLVVSPDMFAGSGDTADTNQVSGIEEVLGRSSGGRTCQELLESRSVTSALHSAFQRASALGGESSEKGVAPRLLPRVRPWHRYARWLCLQHETLPERPLAISEAERDLTKVKSQQMELAKATKAQEQLKLEADKARKEMQDSLQELSATEAKLVAAETKLKNLGTSDGGLGMPAEDEIKDLRNEITQLKQVGKNLQEKLKAAKQIADQYKAIAEGVEQTLRESKQTNKDFQEECEKKLFEAQNAKVALERKVEQLEKDHQELLNENLRITEDSHNLNNDLRKQLATLRLELQEALQLREAAAAEQAKAQQALQQQVELASEAQDKYQRELMLHAADVEAFTALKRKLESHNDDVAKLQAELQSEQQKLLNAQTSWQEQERVLREECRQLETRCDELEKQNKALHSQMEKLSSQAIALQQKASENPLNISLSEEVGKSSDQLMEVIKYLRREKEIAETKLEVAESSAARVQQRLSLLEKQLEETKQALGEERQQNQTTVETMSQHMELMRKVENLNVLTESNKLLREDNNRMQAKLQEMETKVRRLEEELSPLQCSVRELTAQKEVLEVEKRTLTGEVERWKSRTHHLVEQSNKTDPEEHRKLLNEKDQIRKQLAQTKEELFKARAELSRVNSLLNSKENELTAQKQEFIKQSEELQEAKRQLQEEQSEGEKRMTTINQLKKIGRKYKEQSEATQKELDQVKATSVGQQNMQTTAAAAAEQTNKQLSERLSVIERERDEVKAKLAEKEAEVVSLRSQVESIQQELGQQKENLQKLQSEAARLQTENKELERKNSQSKHVLLAARTKINQYKEQLDRLSAEYTEIRQRLAAASSHSGAAQTSKEESEHQAAVRQQLEQQLSQLQQELESARRTSGSLPATTEQLQQENEKLAAEKAELQNKVQQLQRQVEMPKAASAQPAQPIPRQPPTAGASPTTTETPKMASIKPVSTAAAAQHPSSSQAKATASIRPMAIATASTSSGGMPAYPSTSSTPPIVVPVLPTSLAMSEASQDDQPSTSSSLQQPAQQTIPAVSVAGRPQQQVQIVAPQMETTVTEEPVMQAAVVTPSVQEPVVHPVQPAQQQQQTLAMAVSATTMAMLSNVPGPSSSGEQPPAVHLGKRARDESESDEAEIKRIRTMHTQEAAVIPTITVVDENSKLITQIEPQLEMEDVADSTSVGELAVEESVVSESLESDLQEPRVRSLNEDSGDIIIVASDEEGGDQGAEGSELYEGQADEEGAEQEGEVEESEAVEEEGEFEIQQAEQGEENTEGQEEEEQMDDEGLGDAADGEEDEDGDIVIIDIDESEPQTVSQSLESEDGGASGVTSSPRPPPPPLQSLPIMRSERLPSASHQLTPAPFLAQSVGAFEDDDCLVPSTPTLSQPRRSDGFAEALNSPHPQHPQRFVFTGGPDGGSQPELAQLESQGALGMDDTRMDLSQFDDPGSRSVPTTPLPQQASAPGLFESTAQSSSQPPTQLAMLQEDGSQAAGGGDGQADVTDAGTERGQGDEGARCSDVGEGQLEEETEAVCLEGGAGDEEDTEEASRPEGGSSKPKIQRIVWENPAELTPTPSTSTAPIPQPIASRPFHPSGGLRRGAVPTRPGSRGSSWRGTARGSGLQTQPPRGVGTMRRAGQPRGGFHRGGQF